MSFPFVCTYAYIGASLRVLVYSSGESLSRERERQGGEVGRGRADEGAMQPREGACPSYRSAQASRTKKKNAKGHKGSDDDVGRAGAGGEKLLPPPFAAPFPKSVEYLFFDFGV